PCHRAGNEKRCPGEGRKRQHAPHDGGGDRVLRDVGKDFNKPGEKVNHPTQRPAGTTQSRRESLEVVSQDLQLSGHCRRLKAIMLAEDRPVLVALTGNLHLLGQQLVVLSETEDRRDVTSGGDAKTVQRDNRVAAFLLHTSQALDKALERTCRILVPVLRKLGGRHVGHTGKLVQPVPAVCDSLADVGEKAGDCTTRKFRLGSKRGEGGRKTNNLVRAEPREVTHRRELGGRVDNLRLGSDRRHTHRENRRPQVFVLGGVHIQQLGQATKGGGGLLDGHVRDGGEHRHETGKLVNVLRRDTQLTGEGTDFSKCTPTDRNRRE